MADEAASGSFLAGAARVAIRNPALLDAGLSWFPRLLRAAGDPTSMTNRGIAVATAQPGPIRRAERMTRPLERALHRGVEQVVCPDRPETCQRITGQAGTVDPPGRRRPAR